MPNGEDSIPTMKPKRILTIMTVMIQTNIPTPSTGSMKTISLTIGFLPTFSLEVESVKSLNICLEQGVMS